jgi:hypothetical protein
MCSFTDLIEKVIGFQFSICKNTCKKVRFYHKISFPTVKQIFFNVYQKSSGKLETEGNSAIGLWHEI